MPIMTTETYDATAVDLLLAGDVTGLARLSAEARRTLPGKGETCQRCGNDSFLIYDGLRECDHCGLGEGETP